MKTAQLKTRELMRRLHNVGIEADFQQSLTLRRAEKTLQRWAELECGDGDDYKSYNISRDEQTGKPFIEFHPHKGESYKRPIADKEKGALNRIEAICKELGIYYYHQGDPRGCALYVSKEPLPDNNYTGGIACCD